MENLMKKHLIGLLSLSVVTLICVAFWVTCVFAAPSTVYVDQKSGNDSNNGTSQSTAYATLDKAINTIAKDGGKIILCSDYEFKANTKYFEPSHKGEITISTLGDAKLTLLSNAQYNLAGPTTFKDINIYNEGNVHFVACFNPIVFDTGVNMSCRTNTKAVKVYGGYYEASESSKTNLDSHITIKS